MNAAPDTSVFISYRRDDSAGYAGRLEASLERRLGGGRVFRDVMDIAPGTDFAEVIRERLASAKSVIVLIGPRWAGGNEPGSRRIDEPGDFVRIEVQEALASGARVVPVLLPGATMPTAEQLPEPLRPLARRNAMTLGDTHWEADVDRLVAALALQARRRVWPWIMAGALGAAAVCAGLSLWLGPGPADQELRLAGTWQAEVRYDWGDRHTERFVFERHAGSLTGTAAFLGFPRPVEALRFDGTNLHFETRSRVSMSGEPDREQTLAYAAELRGDGADTVLAFRLQISGGYQSHRPVDFVARRVASPASAP